jgi:hypothetical protein
MPAPQASTPAVDASTSTSAAVASLPVPEVAPESVPEGATTQDASAPRSAVASASAALPSNDVAPANKPRSSVAAPAPAPAPALATPVAVPPAPSTEDDPTSGGLDLSALIAFSAAVQAGQYKELFEPQTASVAEPAQVGGADSGSTAMDGIQSAPPLPASSSTSALLPESGGDSIIIDFAELEGKALAGEFDDSSEVFSLAPSGGPSVYKPPPLFPLAGPSVVKAPPRPPPRSAPARPPAPAMRPPTQVQSRPSTPVGARPPAPRPPAPRPSAARPLAPGIARPTSSAPPARPPGAAVADEQDPFGLRALEEAVLAGRADEFELDPAQLFSPSHARPPSALASSGSRPPTPIRPPPPVVRPAVGRPAPSAVRPPPQQRSHPGNVSSPRPGTTPVRPGQPRLPPARPPTTGVSQPLYPRTTGPSNAKAGPSSQAPKQRPPAASVASLPSLLDAPFSTASPAMVVPASRYPLSEKRQYLSLLPAQSLVNIILRLTDTHPMSPAFPPNIKDVILDLEVEALKPRNRSASPSPLATTPMLQRTSSTPGTGSVVSRRPGPMVGPSNGVGRTSIGGSTVRPPPPSRPTTPAQTRPLSSASSAGPLMPSQSQPMTNGIAGSRPPLSGPMKSAITPVRLVRSTRKVFLPLVDPGVPPFPSGATNATLVGGGRRHNAGAGSGCYSDGRGIVLRSVSRGHGRVRRRAPNAR